MAEIEITPQYMIYWLSSESFCFSRAELDFLRGAKAVNASYRRLLLHRIKKKLEYFKEEILPVLANNEKTSLWVESVTKNSNSVTEFSNAQISSNQASLADWKCGRRVAYPNQSV